MDRNNLSIEWPVRISLPFFWKLCFSSWHKQSLALIYVSTTAQMNSKVPQHIMLHNTNLIVTAIQIPSSAY